MGQYYRPVVLKHNWKTNNKPVKASVLCYDYDDGGWSIGAKLTEHSYVGNPMVEDMVELLGTKYKGHPFVWAGDYADEVEINGKAHDIYNDANRYIYNNYDDDRDDSKQGIYLTLLEDLKEGERHGFKYLVNLTKKQYCEIPKRDPNNYIHHPLPLLTVIGNGRGGGDYGLDDERVGSWAFNKILATNDPADFNGFTKIDGFFEYEY